MNNLENNVIDCRSKDCNLKYDNIINSFKALREGEAIKLITNSDPKKLYYEMMDKENGNFYWVYVNEGPAEWDVMIEKALSF